jgi:hypothetical protein
LEGKKKAKDWPETHWQVSRSPEKCAIWSEKENFQQKERVSSLGTLLLLQKKKIKVFLRTVPTKGEKIRFSEKIKTKR